MPIGIVESLDHEARGIVRQDGKAIFVDGALPGETVEETLCSHLLKSNCLVTGQPDWAMVVIRYRGAPIDRAGLARPAGQRSAVLTGAGQAATAAADDSQRRTAIRSARMCFAPATTSSSFADSTEINLMVLR